MSIKSDNTPSFNSKGLPLLLPYVTMQLALKYGMRTQV